MREINEKELKEMFDELLNESNEKIRIGCLEYDPSEVLKTCDPTAYRCGLSDYIDSLLSDGDLEEENGTYFLK